MQNQQKNDPQISPTGIFKMGFDCKELCETDL